MADATTIPAKERTAQQLEEQVEQVERLAATFLDSLDETSLRKEMVCRFTKAGRTSEARFPIGDLLWHEVEEELQHRGELNALLWQIDVHPPIATVEDWKASKVPRAPE